MSKQNGETSTFEIETRETFNEILLAINDLRQDFVSRLDRLETEQTEIRQILAAQQNEARELKNYAELQFEAIRQGLVANSNQMDRLVSEISENRAVIFSTKAMLGELNERVFLLTRSIEPSFK